MKRFHVHVNVDDLGSAELAEIGRRLAAADAIELAQTGTTCCYAHSDTYRSEDPQGLRRECFHTHGAAMKHFDAAAEAACCDSPAPAADPHVAVAAAGACCGPAAGPAASCCA